MFNYFISSRNVRLLICCLVSIAGLLFSSQAGFYYLGFIDSYGIGINIVVVVFIESYFFTWIEQWETIEIQIQKHVGEATPKLF